MLTSPVVSNTFVNSHSRVSVPGGPLDRRERIAQVRGQLGLVPPVEDGAGDGAVLLGAAMMITRASRFPAVMGPATSTFPPLVTSEMLAFWPPLRTVVSDSYCQVKVVPLAALTTALPLLWLPSAETTVPRS